MKRTLAAGALLALFLFACEERSPLEPDRPYLSSPPDSLFDSGPITVTADSQVVSGYLITAVDTIGINVNGYVGVTIEDCEIRHSGAAGISFSNADGITIRGCWIIHTGAPESGPHTAIENNIQGFTTDSPLIYRVKLDRGSSGVYLQDCPDALVRVVEGNDFRGPYPRGQLLQFNRCDRSELSDFSSVNPLDTCWSEDVVSIFNSDSCYVMRGVIDGTNSPSGNGITFESATGGWIQSVDTINMGNGSFAATNNSHFLFWDDTRDIDHYCEDVGRGEPLSGGRIWLTISGSDSTCSTDGIYWPSMPASCAGVDYNDPKFSCRDHSLEEFTPRSPLDLTFSWEEGPPEPDPPEEDPIEP